jgi:hypothetical protein
MPIGCRFFQKRKRTPHADRERRPAGGGIAPRARHGGGGRPRRLRERGGIPLVFRRVAQPAPYPAQPFSRSAETSRKGSRLPPRTGCAPRPSSNHVRGPRAVDQGGDGSSTAAGSTCSARPNGPRTNPPRIPRARLPSARRARARGRRRGLPSPAPPARPGRPRSGPGSGRRRSWPASSLEKIDGRCWTPPSRFPARPRRRRRAAARTARRRRRVCRSTWDSGRRPRRVRRAGARRRN